MRVLMLCCALLALAGCISSRAIVMRNPANGQTVDCGSQDEAWLWSVVTAPGREEACVHDYQAQGWERTPN
jgi:hypothetical protein